MSGVKLRNMRILAIETSCDETAIAIADFSPPFPEKAGQAGSKSKPRIRVLSNIVSSQVKLHAKFGGVVPNLAKREHQRNLTPILIAALKESKLLRSKTNRKTDSKTIEKILEREQELLTLFKKKILSLEPPAIDAIAVTMGPGLEPALWVGINFAKALSHLWRVPLIPVSHMAGHLYSAFLQKNGTRKAARHALRTFQFPMLSLLVSGGHTELVLARGHGKWKILGQTRDDAAGEAFDKVARILNLGYPGGPALARLAEKGNERNIIFPKPMINSNNYDFSFSGLKTAVLYYLRDHKYANKKDVAAAFQKAVVDVLVAKTLRAAKTYKPKIVALGGGVAANKKLRDRIGKELKKELPKTTYLLPDMALTGDNALMIAIAAYFSGRKKALTEVKADGNLTL